MKLAISLVLSVVMMGLLPVNVTAKEVSVVVEVPYKSFNADVRKSAIDKARHSAWKKYATSFSVARLSTYRANEAEFINNLSGLIADEVVVQEKNDKKAKLFKLSLRVNVNDNAVTALFNDLSASGNQALGMSSDFGSVLIARVKMTAKRYDDKRVDVRESEASDSVSQVTASNGTESIDSATTKSMSRNASGGSTSRKRTAVTWEVDEAYQEQLAAAIEESLINAGFEPMDYNDLADYGAPYMDELYGETTDKGVLKGSAQRIIKDAAKDAGWDFIGMGNVDLDLPIIDGATGLFKVAASVAYRVYMFQDGKSRSVARVRAKQVYGLGETEDFATSEALNKAAHVAVTTVVDQLQKKGVR